jgi:hypothetical protein
MSPADRDDARLPARVEALLAKWPLAETAEEEWEARAQAIQARLLKRSSSKPGPKLRRTF